MYALASLRCPLVSAALLVAFAWQAWHLVHSQVPWSPPLCRWLLRGRRGTWCAANRSDVRPGVPPVSLGLRRSAGGFCVAGAALGAVPRGRMYALASLRCPLVSAAFAWQAWHLVHSQVRPGVPPVSLGLRRSAGGFCVAGAALGALPRGQMYALASPGVPWSPPLCRWLLRGRRGTWCGGVAPMAATCLKPSEYRGGKNTAVAGRLVIWTRRELSAKQPSQGHGQPKGKKGKWGKGASSSESNVARKVEAHLAANGNPTEVLYIEAWGEIGDKLLQLCQVGDLVAIQGGTVQAAPAAFSTSRLHYHLRLKGTLGITVLATKLTEDPWADVPDLHPLVPLRALSRVKDRQKICVAAVIIDNPGAIERQTKEKMAMVRNAIIQQGNTKVRCAFWHEHAEELATKAVNEAVLLYQVLVTKRKSEDSWELSSWRGTSIQQCPAAMAELLTLARNFVFLSLSHMHLLGVAQIEAA